MLSQLKQISIHNPYSYDDYKSLLVFCVSSHDTTGLERTQERIDATKLNVQRMKRLDKQIVLSQTLEQELKKVKKKWIWIVLSEAWCGDSAQCLPIINKMAAAAPSIELKIALRDENLPLMDSHLNGMSRAIPKLICVDAETNREVGTWGPRPQNIQGMVTDFKAANPTVSHNDFVLELHTWYAKDKGEGMMREFEELIPQWIKL